MVKIGGNLELFEFRYFPSNLFRLLPLSICVLHIISICWGQGELLIGTNWTFCSICGVYPIRRGFPPSYHYLLFSMFSSVLWSALVYSQPSAIYSGWVYFPHPPWPLYFHLLVPGLIALLEPRPVWSLNPRCKMCLIPKSAQLTEVRDSSQVALRVTKHKGLSVMEMWS